MRLLLSKMRLMFENRVRRNPPPQCVSLCGSALRRRPPCKHLHPPLPCLTCGFWVSFIELYKVHPCLWNVKQYHMLTETLKTSAARNTSLRGSMLSLRRWGSKSDGRRPVFCEAALRRATIFRYKAISTSRELPWNLSRVISTTLVFCDCIECLFFRE